MRTLKSILLAGAMLLAIPAFFSSCQEDAPQIDYTMSVTVVNDFSKVVDAINNGTLKNEQAIAQLTAAIDKMNADQQTKLQAIKDVLNSVNATIDAKLAVIEAAMKAQTLSLEGKLALIEDAMKAQTLALEKKCDALVAAIKALPDYTEKLQAIEKAISALPDYTAKLEAIEKALTSQTLALAEKLGFIQAALEDQTIAMKEKMDILKGVINDQTKALDLRLGALETAMKNQTLELKDKLALLNSTLETQTLTLANKLEAISSAVEAMPDYTSKLAAIEAAIKALPNYEAQLKALNALITDQNSKLDDQIAALEGIMNAIPDYSNKLDAIENAIKAMPDYDAAINSIKDEIAKLVKAVEDGNKSEADALAEIAKKIEALKENSGGEDTSVKSSIVFNVREIICLDPNCNIKYLEKYEPTIKFIVDRNAAHSKTNPLKVYKNGKQVKLVLVKENANSNLAYYMFEGNIGDLIKIEGEIKFFFTHYGTQYDLSDAKSVEHLVLQYNTRDEKYDFSKMDNLKTLELISGAKDAGIAWQTIAKTIQKKVDGTAKVYSYVDDTRSKSGYIPATRKYVALPLPLQDVKDFKVCLNSDNDAKLAADMFTSKKWEVNLQKTQFIQQRNELGYTF